MKKKQIFISSPTFAKVVKSPLKMLQETNWDIKLNESGRSLSPEELLNEAKTADALIVSTENLHGIIDRFENLKLISRTGIGLDSVPVSRCKELGIRVHYTPDAVTEAVSEMVLGILICLTRRVIQSDREIRKNNWPRFIGKSLHESKIGIVGFGRVGKSLTRLLKSFSPESVLINDEREITDEVNTVKKETGLNLQITGLDDLFRSADFVTLHVPKKKNTLNLVSRQKLSLMKKDAFLINFSRGGIVNEHDLHECLSQKRIEGAALDVFSEEPYQGPLCDLPNIILTSHMGSCSVETRLKMDTQAAQAVIDFFENKPLSNEVDYDSPDLLPV